MRRKILATTLALAITNQPLLAGSVVGVALAPISHADATLVVVGPDGEETSYTPSELEELPTYSLTTSTPWRDEPATFEGVLLKDVLTASSLDGVAAITVTAENDYTTIIEREIWETVDILVATRVNGRPHSRRVRGPIQFIIDLDTYTASDLTSESNLVWMAARIEPHF